MNIYTTLDWMVDLYRTYDSENQNPGYYYYTDLRNRSEYVFNFHNIDCYSVSGFDGNFTLQVMMYTPMISILMIHEKYRDLIYKDYKAFCDRYSFELAHEIGHSIDPFTKRRASDSKNSKRPDESFDEYYIRTYNQKSEFFADSFAAKMYGFDKAIKKLEFMVLKSKQMVQNTKNEQCLSDLHKRLIINDKNLKERLKNIKKESI